MLVQTCNVHTLHVHTQQIYRLLIYNLLFLGGGAKSGCFSHMQIPGLECQQNLFPQCGHSSGKSSECSFICFSKYFFSSNDLSHSLQVLSSWGSQCISNAFDIQLLTCTHGHILDKYMYNISWSEHFYEP